MLDQSPLQVPLFILSLPQLWTQVIGVSFASQSLSGLFTWHPVITGSKIQIVCGNVCSFVISTERVCTTQFLQTQMQNVEQMYFTFECKANFGESLYHWQMDTAGCQNEQEMRQLQRPKNLRERLLFPEHRRSRPA